ncbi:MAG: S8 family serine peptidase [Dokdonella sp.]|uniref:S8 family serine peptidase n=1 Tax=Dokdonella sp. TaxID=2291710 RepID=UPI003F7FC444
MHDVASARPARARRPRLPGRFLSPMLGAALLVFCNGLLASTGAVRTPAAQIRGSAAAPGNPATTSIEIAPALQRRLAAGERSGFAIEFRERADLSAARSLDWTARGRYVYERLRDTAERSQAVVRRLLRERGVAFHAYWIKNTILVEQGDMQTLQRVAQSPGVARIRELPKAELIAPEHPAVRTAARPHDADGATDNVAWIGADHVWNDGTTGDGVTVGIIDDGVFYRHEAVVQQYRGNLGAGGFVHDYNWYAPLLETSEPDGSQGQGHGTHVTGTVVGDNGAGDAQLRRRTGVAPGARWIACLGLPIKGSEFALPACGEFMLAPTKTDGSAPNPDLRPQVVNNSWGSYSLCDGSADDFYRDVVEAWVAAGIFPVFAAGNAGNCGLPEPPGLSTVTSPDSLGSAFAVGSTGNHDGAYAPHSLWGPGLEASAGLPDYPDPRGYPTMKPQVVAPGVDILSAIDGGDGYATMTGTSMSAPHIAGLVALMLEAGECLRGDYAALGGILMQTARPIDYASGGSPPPGIGNLPNYATGWGEVDAPRAVDAAAHACGPQGFIRGRVESATGTPIAGAKIEVFVDENVRVYQATSGIDGRYVRRMPVDAGGGYTVRVSAYGYLPSSEGGVRVQADATTLHDVVLATAPMVKVAGRVVDAATGWPLHAKITISGYPDGPVWSDPVSGRYSVRLPEGRPYRFDVASDVAGYQAASRELASVAAAAEQDFALDADLIACEAPGYTYASNVLAETFEDNGSAPPPGWSRSSAGLGWLFGDSSETSASIFPIPAHGRFAAANDELGAGEGLDNDGRSDYLQLPALNLAIASPVLRYRSYYVDTGGHARVEASTDGGTSWNALGAPKSAYERVTWTDETLALSAAAASGVRLRFHSDDGSSDNEPRLGGPWAIDDVRVVGACTPPASGGLVVGHVRDANTGLGLDGAEVRIAGGTAVATLRSDDPGVGSGFFAAHAPGGTPGVTATRGTLPAGYGEASASANVTNGATSRVDLALPAGRLRLYPAAPAATVELGTTAHASLTADNSGTAPLAFGFEGPAIEEHFEVATFPPAGWDIVTVGDGCPWSALDPAQAWNTAGGDGRAAMVDLYPCWGGEASDTALVSPPLDLSASHTASVGFFLSLFEGADNAPRLDIDASADGGATWTTVHSETRENNGSGPGALIELDLSAFAGASDVRVRFHYTGTPPWGSVIIDQVHLFESINANVLLDVTPDHGTLAVGGSRALDILFDARELAQPGVYRVPIRVAEDTPYDWPFGDVEATMTVTAPASYGALVGAVRGLGACDAHPAALAGATIAIHAATGESYTTTTGDDGAYRYWVEASHGPFTLTVEAPAHQPVTQAFAVVAGNDTPADIDLRALQPCLGTDPAAPVGNVAAGQSMAIAFDLLNTGAAPTDWSLRVGGDPAVPTPVPLVQTTSPTPTQDTSFACINPPTGYTLDNRYLRRFDLATRGAPVMETTVRGVTFAVDSAMSATGSQPVTVRVHALHGEFTFANLELLAEKTIDVADTSLERISVTFDTPLHVAGDSVLVAEIHVPSGVAGASTFFPGGNSDGEIAPAYWAAHDCGVDEPLAYPEAGFDWVHLILELDTRASDPCGANAVPVDWLALAPASGHIGSDAMQTLQALFDATSHADGVYGGSMCLASATTTLVVPVTMQVGGGADAIFADGFD